MLCWLRPHALSLYFPRELAAGAVAVVPEISISTIGAWLLAISPRNVVLNSSDMRALDYSLTSSAERSATSE